MEQTPEDFRQRLGAYIRARRLEAGINQINMGLAISSDSGNISWLERGAQGFSDAMIYAIARELQIPLSEIFAVAEGLADDREAKIIRIYRSADAHGKEVIRFATEAAEMHTSRTSTDAAKRI